MTHHKSLSEGEWRKLSLLEQLGNIGSEISRAGRWQGKDEELFNGAVERALELFDLTLEDPRWRKRMREIARAREVFCDTVFGKKEYQSSLEDLLRYFDQFAYAVRLRVV
mgnify:FL=1